MIWHVKNDVSLIPKVPFGSRWMQKTKGELANSGLTAIKVEVFGVVIVCVHSVTV